MSTFYSDEYQELLKQYRKQRPDWGNTGHTIAGEIRNLMRENHYTSVLDYGCGNGSLRTALLLNPPCDIYGGSLIRLFDQYDPGVEGKEICPDRLYDLVVCKDVLEHVEPECLDNVLTHLARLTGKMLWCQIAYVPAPAILPNGQNAHVTLLSPGEWIERLSDYFDEITAIPEDHQHCWFFCKYPNLFKII